MKCQILFPGKKKKNISRCHLLKIEHSEQALKSVSKNSRAQLFKASLA